MCKSATLSSKNLFMNGIKKIIEILFCLAFVRKFGEGYMCSPFSSPFCISYDLCNQFLILNNNRVKCSADFCLMEILGTWQCPLLNISYCPPSEAVLSDGKSLVRSSFYFKLFDFILH